MIAAVLVGQNGGHFLADAVEILDRHVGNEPHAGGTAAGARVAEELIDGLIEKVFVGDETGGEWIGGERVEGLAEGFVHAGERVAGFFGENELE